MIAVSIVGVYRRFGGTYLFALDGGSMFLRNVGKHLQITRCQNPEEFVNLFRQSYMAVEECIELNDRNYEQVLVIL
jgi:hypothetical protein